jgi:hypothetical protein
MLLEAPAPPSRLLSNSLFPDSVTRLVSAATPGRPAAGRSSHHTGEAALPLTFAV